MGTLRAQQIDLSLHPTAVPDSFVVRATATEGSWGAVPNGVFTIRWEVAAGGLMNNSDVRPSCPGYTLTNYGGTVDIGNYRYFTVVLFGDRAIGPGACSITPAGIAIGGLRIRELSGCRHVQLVQNAYTGLNNLDYYFSMGGIDMTGSITSAPIAGGVCGPCEPPVITSASAVQASGCTGPIALNMTVDGDPMDHSWYGLYSGTPVSDQPAFTLPSGPAGPFLAVANNACGTDSMVVPVEVDPGACVVPVITHAYYTFATSYISFTIAAVGPCLQYVVISPNGTPHSQGGNGQVGFPHSNSIGEYLAIAYNACGADTVVLSVDEIQECSVPQLVSTSGSVPPCGTSPLVLSSTAVGPGPIGYLWRDPFGTVVGNWANVTLADVMEGDYSITVSNVCGSSWMAVPVVLDTVGVGACVPPQIAGITTNGPLCAGDTVLLEADVIAAGPCLHHQWGGAQVIQADQASTSAPGGTGLYTLTVSNACGSTSMSVQASVIEQQERSVLLCSPVGLLLLDSLAQVAAPIDLPPGAWSLNGQPHAAYYDPAVDTTGQYFYHLDGTDCAVVRLSVHEDVAVHAGADTAITVCSTDAPVALFPLLGGAAAPGGSWTIGIASMNGIYDPAIHNSNTCRYTVTNQGCYDQAIIVVTELPATTWYADTDGDGLGDAGAEVMACDPPDGHVANSDDPCPALYGVIGDVCDDGDPATVNDVIDEACTCAGEPGTGITEHDKGGVAIWPNPTRGNTFFLRIPVDRGRVDVSLADATGRIIHRLIALGSSAPTEVRVPVDMAVGSYLVRLVHDHGTEVKALVVGY